jgi:ribonuclease PH
MRKDGRAKDQLREIKVTRDYIKYAEGSVLIEAGNTRVICTATVDDNIPPFLKGMGQGWVTAEYSMLPRSTHRRNQREASRGRVGGRTHEIQRLIGRALRSVVNLNELGERTIFIDCDVIQADGGTRTLSITGAYIALYSTIKYLMDNNLIDTWPIKDSLAAISVGIMNGDVLLDLNYHEDSNADADMNIIMTGSGMLVEVQGTAEKAAFSHAQLDKALKVAAKGIKDIILKQNEILGIDTQY